MKKIVEHILDATNLATWILQSSSDSQLKKAAAKVIHSADEALNSVIRIKQRAK